MKGESMENLDFIRRKKLRNKAHRHGWSIVPRSICECGHTGDGENSEHDPEPYPGYPEYDEPGGGSCTKCDCKQFTWAGWLETGLGDLDI